MLRVSYYFLSSLTYLQIADGPLRKKNQVQQLSPHHHSKVLSSLKYHIMPDLVELDSVEILVIVDNELDPISQSPNPAVLQSGGLKEIGINGKALSSAERGGAPREMRMDGICCGAHGLSLMITGVRNGERRTILFDTGPEEHVWERNATRLRADFGKIEVIQLSHWHRDHSGGMLRAIDMINEASGREHSKPVHVDLHPARPDYRGVRPPEMPVISLEADPTFEQIWKAGALVQKNDEPHTVLDDYFLVSGEIPRVTDYEKGLRFGVRYDAAKNEWRPDEKMADERFLMCEIKNKGILMFTGCSHAGVVNASRHSITLGSGTSLYAVMGGFHLADAEAQQIQATAQDLKALSPKVLLTGHCTGWRAKFELQKEMPAGTLVPSFVGSKFVL